MNQLINRGWVRRAKRDGDGRLVWLELTAEGDRAVIELAAARATRFTQLLHNNPVEQHPAVIEALTALVHAAAGRPAPVDASPVTHE